MYFINSSNNGSQICHKILLYDNQVSLRMYRVLGTSVLYDNQVSLRMYRVLGTSVSYPPHKRILLSWPGHDFRFYQITFTNTIYIPLNQSISCFTSHLGTGIIVCSQSWLNCISTLGRGPSVKKVLYKLLICGGK